MLRTSAASRRARWRPAVAVALLLAAPSPRAFEGDVHYGLTHWLALKAGFDTSQADAIAVGNQRVDGGLMDTLELALENECVEHSADAAQQVQQRHLPAAKPAPASPEQRAVTPGSTAAQQPLVAVMKNVPGKEGLMLGKLGEALHTLQDSWSHQGMPGVPSPGGGLECDPALASGHAAARGGTDSHAADHTHRWTADVLAMARATYGALLAYPPIQRRERTPSAWDSLVEPIDRFSQATTKTQKRDWFVAQGMPDTSFLEGLSLPDGPQPGPLRWAGRKLPPLPSAVSNQHDVPTDTRAFFDRLIVRWLGSDAVEAVVAELSMPEPQSKTEAENMRKARQQLTARLALWKLRDHGSAAELAHARAPLTSEQLRAADRLTKDSRAFVQPASIADAFFPLQARGPYASPLLPYIVRSLPAASGMPRAIAIARLKHAPYDSIGWIAQKHGERWILVDMVAVVDQ